MSRVVSKIHVCLSTVFLSAVSLFSASPAHAEVDWDSVAQCESGGNWAINTGNGFHGGLQFTMGTWASNGGSGSPEGASRDEQIRVANNVLNTQGIGAWPVCGRRGGSASYAHQKVTPPAETVEKPAETPQPAPESAPAEVSPGFVLPQPFDIVGVSHVTFTAVPWGDSQIAVPQFNPYVADQG